MLIDALCSNKAQHMGVAKVKQIPQMRTLRGVELHGYFIKIPFFSKLFMMTGVITKNSSI